MKRNIEKNATTVMAVSIARNISIISDAPSNTEEASFTPSKEAHVDARRKEIFCIKILIIPGRTIARRA